MADDNNKKKFVFDTDQQYLGNVYAKALMGLATKSGSVDNVLGELHSFVDVLDRLPKLKDALESPRIGFSEKEKILEKAIKGKASPEFLNFAKVVCRKGRADCFSAIADSAQAMHDEMSGSVQATMTTAVEVNDSVREKVSSRLASVLGKKVTLEANVDPNIIGGLVVRVGDTVYDGSVTNQLKQVRSSAIGKANQQIRQALDRFATEG